MIITVTLNPAVDKTVRVEKLNIGGLSRIREMRMDAGGKGINVSRAISALGGESLAMGLLGGAQGAFIRGALRDGGIRSAFTEIAGETRTNLKVVADDGTVTELNEPGPEITKEEMDMLRRSLEMQIHAGDLLILSGSAPKGTPDTCYAELIQLAHACGAEVLLDADGERFAAGVSVRPDIVKPNLHELMEYCRCRGIKPDGDTERDRAVYAGRMLIAAGIREVIVSMGEDGALFLNGESTWHVPAIPVKVSSTVGAGDVMAAAYALGCVQGLAIEERMRLAVAASAGAVATQGTNPPAQNCVETLKKQVHILTIEP